MKEERTQEELRRIAKRSLKSQIGDVINDNDATYGFVNEVMETHDDPLIRKIHETYQEYFYGDRTEELEHRTTWIEKLYPERGECFEDIYMSFYMEIFNELVQEALEEELGWYVKYNSDRDPLVRQMRETLTKVGDTEHDISPQLADHYYRISGEVVEDQTLGDFIEREESETIGLGTTDDVDACKECFADLTHIEPNNDGYKVCYECGSYNRFK